jgi:peptidoglycan/xylan/chitin deacetylase (PgdA/CDA1 family)
MPTDSTTPRDNRAVSALFRVIGGAAPRCEAEACQYHAHLPMNVPERMFLSCWMPLALWVAVADALAPWLGRTASWLLGVPLVFLASNLLPVSLAVRTPRAQWRLWLFLGVLWAAFHLRSGGIAGAMAAGWMILLAMNALASVWLLLGKTLSLSGNAGIVWRWCVLIGAHALAFGIGIRFGTGWAVAACAAVSGLCLWPVLNPGCQWLGPVVRRMPDRRILVTIDDGPDPKDTPVLLDLLDRHGMKAVFFMIGEKVAAHPELAREVVRRGHAIGNHTMSHPQASFWCAGPSRTRREIADCQKVIEDTTGVAPRWFRAPVGHRNWFTHPVAGSLGLEVMAWNRRGYDAVETDADKVLKRLLTNLGPGDIVLTHESTPIAARVLEGVLERIDRQTKAASS